MGKKLPSDFYSEFISKNSPAINKKISSFKIGIAGCGGLGSNAAAALARAGVLNFVIVDTDKIEISNLNRQQYFINDLGKYKVDALSNILKSINPIVKVEAHKTKLNFDNLKKIFNECQIVVEAFDTVEAKSVIIKTFTEKIPDKYLVCASGLAGFGKSNKIKTKKLTKNIFICGDNQTEPGPPGGEENESIGLMAPRVILTAAHQANKVLEIISNVSKDQIEN